MSIMPYAYLIGSTTSCWLVVVDFYTTFSICIVRTYFMPFQSNETRTTGIAIWWTLYMVPHHTHTEKALNLYRRNLLFGEMCMYILVVVFQRNNELGNRKIRHQHHRIYSMSVWWNGEDPS